MDSVIKYGFGLVVVALLIDYFLQIVFLFGIFYGFINFGFDLFLCLGAEQDIVTLLSSLISFEILFFLIYWVYTKFFK